jgi:hypothetical protein
MPTKFQFVLSLPDGRGEPGDELRFGPIMIGLRALVEIDLWHLKNTGPYPRLLQDSKVFYREEKPGKEDWLDIPTLEKIGFGDCEDLACRLCAERIFYDGCDCEPVIRWRHISAEKLLADGYPPDKIPPDGIYLIHVMIRHSDGTVECPSAQLGMIGDF